MKRKNLKICGVILSGVIVIVSLAYAIANCATVGFLAFYIENYALQPPYDQEEAESVTLTRDMNERAKKYGAFTVNG